MKIAAKFRIALLFTLLGTTTIQSCKKCYVCTCTDTTTAFGCTQQGEAIEMCDRGLVGKTALTARIMEKESEGYTCSVK
jgi:hypothetical protein